MPVFSLVTNVKIHNAKALALELSKLGAELLKKPEMYISVNITYSETLSFAGTFDPAFILSLASLDNINPQANEVYSKALFKFFHDKLGVLGTRGYIAFNDPGRAFIGHEGTTFATILAGK